MLGGGEEWPEKSLKLHVIKQHTTAPLHGKDMPLPAIQRVILKLRLLMQPLRVGRDTTITARMNRAIGEC